MYRFSRIRPAARKPTTVAAAFSGEMARGSGEGGELRRGGGGGRRLRGAAEAAARATAASGARCCGGEMRERAAARRAERRGPGAALFKGRRGSAVACGRGKSRPAAARRGGSGLRPELGDERGAVTGRLGRGLATGPALVRSVLTFFLKLDEKIK